MTGLGVKLPSQTSSPKDAGGKKVSELISADTKIDPSGKVTGTIHKVTMDSFGGKEGYYFPVTLDSKYQGQKITVTGVNGPKTAADLDWLIEIANAQTKVTFATDTSKVFLTLTFESVTFDGAED